MENSADKVQSQLHQVGRDFPGKNLHFSNGQMGANSAEHPWINTTKVSGNIHYEILGKSHKFMKIIVKNEKYRVGKEIKSRVVKRFLGNFISLRNFCISLEI